MFSVPQFCVLRGTTQNLVALAGVIRGPKNFGTLPEVAELCSTVKNMHLP